MKNETEIISLQNLTESEINIRNRNSLEYKTHNNIPEINNDLSEILFITSYPPRECGIATYSQDLIKALNNKFSNSLSIKVCAIESGKSNFSYPAEVKYILNTSIVSEYKILASTINNNNHLKIVLIQHEFGFFKKQEQAFLQFIYDITKPIIIVFHTVLPKPDYLLKSEIKNITSACESVIVMTHISAGILTDDYGIPEQKISIIAHGTHLVSHLNKKTLKKKYGLNGRKVLTTFGLLSSGKSIETTLDALPAIIKHSPDIAFLIIGKTHPEVKKQEGEKYREKLEQLVKQNSLQKNVIFINKYVELPELLEYLQLTDIYLFTTNDPNQAVSGTFVYAMSCACPIISTPIPHARELLTENTGITFDFQNSEQLAGNVIRLLNDEPLRKNISSNTLQKIVSTAWENSANEHAILFEDIPKVNIKLKYNLPVINLNHIKLITTDTGIIQFSKINQPDMNSGYTLDDNSRALIAMCMYFKSTKDEKCMHFIKTYLSFIKLCQQSDGKFLNYVNKKNEFTDQNKTVNLEDSNGRALWALGHVISLIDILPEVLVSEADKIFRKSLSQIDTMHSTRAMAFTIKGLYLYYNIKKTQESIGHIKTLADRLVQMYRHESNYKWEWFEGYLTYANSVLPEAMLYAWLLFGEVHYKDIAISSFNFLLFQTFNQSGIEVISNKNWLKRGEEAGRFGEQPIDVAYTIMTLSKFYDIFPAANFYEKIVTAFDWFLGKNRLHQIIYNPCTGGCYDGLEETHVNLNQGAESTLSYLMARLTVEKFKVSGKL